MIQHGALCRGKMKYNPGDLCFYTMALKSQLMTPNSGELMIRAVNA